MIIIKYIESQLEIYFSENELPFKRRKSTKVILKNDLK